MINQDAFEWLEHDDGFFDVIVVDLPDPTSYSLGKLYTTAFYSLLDRRLGAYRGRPRRTRRDDAGHDHL